MFEKYRAYKKTDDSYTDFSTITFILNSGVEITRKMATVEIETIVTEFYKSLYGKEKRPFTGVIVIPTYKNINEQNTIIDVSCISSIIF